MADSEDEYDRKRRDKFRGERSSGDGGYRSERRDDRRRDDWTESRNPFRGGAGRARPDYREYRPRERYSPGREMPPAKRMRPDWGDDIRPRYGGYDPYLMHAAWNHEHYPGAHGMHSYGGNHGQPNSHGREQALNSDVQTQPAMMTLKQFLDTQDDGISDSEVLNKYNEYKLEFKRQQLNEFFVTHKDEEWFKNKYHPEESVKRQEEQLSFLKNRVDVFHELLQDGSIGKVSIDTSQSEPLLRLLDTVVIKLEGGTEEDLKVLDEKPKESIPNYPERTFEKKTTTEVDDDVIITSVEKKSDEPDALPVVVSPRPIRRAQVDDEEENWDDDDDDEDANNVGGNNKNDIIENKNTDDAVNDGTPKFLDDEDVDKRSTIEENHSSEITKKALKRKRSESSDSSSSSSSSSNDSSNDSNDSDDEEKTKNKYDLQSKNDDDEKKSEALGPSTLNANLEEDENLNDKCKKEDDDKLKSEIIIQKEEGEEGEHDDDDKKKDENDLSREDENKEILDNDDEKLSSDEKKKLNKIDNDGNDDANVPTETIDLEKEKDEPKPRALHRTSSIFLRNLAPTITKSDIEIACKRFDGFLRVAIADPLVERRWFRRGWVTFKRDVNIKEICWNLNNMRLKDCEMGAIVNRDLSRRVRPVNGITVHKTIVRSDIKLCAKIVMNLDEKFKLWLNELSKDDDIKSNGNTEKISSLSYGFKSNNPVLQNITDFLIEEASAEEDELLGLSAGENKDTSDGDSIERDPQLISVLDNLILYLRIVHSVDFYNHCEYPYEDEMPNRCGIIHARGPVPQNKISQNEIQDYIKNFETKMQTFLAKTVTVESDDLKNLGCKDSDAEVEKFIQSNTQELSKDKWLCPLSGKKFRGPEFIRKHIFNKHAEKVEEVRKEVEYYNNYLKDPKRPQLPEHPGNTRRTNSESQGGGGYRHPHGYVPYAPPYAPYAAPMMMPHRGRGGGFGSGGRRDLPMDHAPQRRIVGYHDLDAPSNFDMFD